MRPFVLILFTFGFVINGFTQTVIAPSLEIDGAIIQGGHVIGHTQADATVSLDGKILPITTNGRFIIGFDRDAHKPLLLTIRSANGTSLERELVPQPRAYAIERVNGLPPATVNPPASVTERTQREAGIVAVARQRRDDRDDWTALFQMPASGRLSGFFGSQRVLNGEPKRPHYGLDVAAPEGAAVTAPAPGIITLAEPDLYFSGGTIILDHGHGLSSTFLHLSSVDVTVGQQIASGELIGKVGASGRATGPHLDWRMNWHDQRIDPRLFIEPNAWEPAN